MHCDIPWALHSPAACTEEGALKLSSVTFTPVRPGCSSALGGISGAWAGAAPNAQEECDVWGFLPPQSPATGAIFTQIPAHPTPHFLALWLHILFACNDELYPCWMLTPGTRLCQLCVTKRNCPRVSWGLSHHHMLTHPGLGCPTLHLHLHPRGYSGFFGGVHSQLWNH